MSETGTAVMANPSSEVSSEFAPLLQEGHLALAVWAAESPGGEIPLERLGALADSLFRLGRNDNWWLGDLLVYGQEHYPEEWFQIVDAIGTDPAEIQDLMRTATLHPAKHRKISTETSPGLSWTKHKIFNGMLQEGLVKEARKLMTQAVSNGWSAEECRQQVKAATVIDTTGTEALAGPGDAQTTILTLNLSVPAEQGELLASIKAVLEEDMRIAAGRAGLMVTNISSRLGGHVPPKGA